MTTKLDRDRPSAHWDGHTLTVRASARSRLPPRPLVRRHRPGAFQTPRRNSAGAYGRGPGVGERGNQGHAAGRVADHQLRRG